MSYLYTVGYVSHEESPKNVLLSEKQYTEEQFDELVIGVSVDLVKKAFAEDPEASIHGFEDLYHDVSERLVKDHGFVKADTQASFRPFGWSSIFDADDWKEHRKDEGQLNRLTKALLMAGFDTSFDSMVRFSKRAKERHGTKAADETAVGEIPAAEEEGGHSCPGT